MTILSEPWRVDERAEKIYTHDGRVSVDFCGVEADRREAMRFFTQAQHAMRLLRLEMVPWDDGLMHDETRCPILAGGKCADWCAEKRAVLRAAGVLDE